MRKKARHSAENEMWASAQCYINQVKLPCVLSSRLVIQNQGHLGGQRGGTEGEHNDLASPGAFAFEKSYL